MNPEVSIIMPYFNKEKYITESVSSVLRQNYDNFELLIIDDQSTDSGVEHIRRFCDKDARVKLLMNSENRGANYCRNLGINKAKGKYLIFFDADDILKENCLRNRVDFMNANLDLDFSVHTMEVFKKTIGDGKFRWNPVTDNPLRDFLLHDLPWQTMQPIWKKRVLEVIGGFDESFQRLQDVDLHTRVLLVPGLKYKLISAEPDCYYRADEQRNNYNAFTFMQRWVSSALQYCDKLYAVVPVFQKKYLYGTIFQTYISVFLSYKEGNLSKESLKVLKSSIWKHQLVVNSSLMQKFILSFSEFYNTTMPRIPGLNRALKKMFVC